MQPSNIFACSALLGAMLAFPASAQTNAPTLYEGARLIIGPASAAPIENGALLVENGVITAIGTGGEVTAPAGAVRVDLTGKP
nr:MAG: hypothetical protein E4H34_05655 [Hyphomicrobiales bacterium]